MKDEAYDSWRSFLYKCISSSLEQTAISIASHGFFRLYQEYTEDVLVSRIFSLDLYFTFQHSLTLSFTVTTLCNVILLVELL